MSKHWYRPSRRERLKEFLWRGWERFWLCDWKDKHEEKMSSYGRCIRCDKPVEKKK